MLKPHFAAPFDVVVDALLAHSSNFPPQSAFVHIMKLIPQKARANCKHVFIVSPTKAVATACRKVSKVLLGGEIERIIPLRDAEALAEYIGEGQLALPPPPAFITGAVTSFVPLVRLGKRDVNSKDVEMRVGTHALFLIKLKSTLIGKSVSRTDIYPLSSLAAVNTVGDDMSITVKDESNLITIRLRGTAVSRAAAALRAAIARAAASDAAANAALSSDTHEANADPSTAPGRLLAAALLNLRSSTATCRDV